MNILVVTKDLAEFNIYTRVAEALRKEDHWVYVVAEGLSMGRWTDGGVTLYSGTTTLDGSGFRTDINLAKCFDDIRPDLVLTGLGVPINLGERFGLEANRRGITLGFIEDVWGAFRRSSAVPDFICTLDQFGADQIKSHDLYREKEPTVYVTGNPALDRLDFIDPHAANHLNIGRYDISIVLAGQDESTTPVIDGLCEAIPLLVKSGKKVLFIPRLHPKFAKRDDLKADWLPKLFGLSSVCTVTLVPLEIEVAQLAMKANMLVSIYSGALQEAAAVGCMPISWVSDVGRRMMSESLGLTDYPMVNQGDAFGVHDAQSFVTVAGRVTSERFYGPNFTKSSGLNQRTKLVVEAITRECR